MELQILTQEKNPSLQREDITAQITFAEKATPSRAQIQEAIAKKCKAKPELVVVSVIDVRFGSTSTKINAFVYESQQALKQFETQHMVKRNEVKAPEPTPEEPKEEAQSAPEEKKDEEPATEEAEKKTEA